MTDEERWAEHENKRRENLLYAYATHDIWNGRHVAYITPSDIERAFSEHQEDAVRLPVLHVLGNTAGFGGEDASACAFVVYQGKEAALKSLSEEKKDVDL